MSMGEWESAHREIVAIGRDRARLEHRLTGALLRALRAQTWVQLGMASFYEYAERFVGLTPRQTEERLRVAHALIDLPRLGAEMAEGRLYYSAVKELTRVATPDTEDAWVEAATGKAINEVQQMVSGRSRGDRPTDVAREEARRHTIVLDLSAEEYATYREAQGKLRHDCDRHLTEGEGVMLMARSVLGGPSDPGRSSYQITMTMCQACKRVDQDGRGQVVTVDAVTAEMVQCDAQRVDDKGHATQDVPPATRRLVMRRQHGRCGVTGCRNAVFIDVHHVQLRSEDGAHDPDNLMIACSVHHKAIHRGAIVVEGSWSTGLRFLHADGSPYGSVEEPHVAAVLADVQAALTGMGFKEREARERVKAIRPRVGVGTALQDALRMALARTASEGTGSAEVPHVAVVLRDVQSALIGMGFNKWEARERVNGIRPRVGVGTVLQDALRMALARTVSEVRPNARAEAMHGGVEVAVHA